MSEKSISQKLHKLYVDLIGEFSPSASHLKPHT